jgi:hypothetical protein
MKLLERIIRYFYSIESKTSKQQLLEDFGEFPPTPLCCESLEGELEVVRVNWIGDIYQNYFHSEWLCMLPEADLHLLSPEAVKLVDGYGPIRRLLGRFRSTFTKRLVLSVPLGVCILWLTTTGKFPKNLGCFLPLNKNKLQIIIKAGRLRAIPRDELPVISHEHIHLLQFKNREKERKADAPQYWRRRARVSQDILKEKKLSDNLMLEWLQKNETEARLHECVLSFYRVHRELPMTITGFLGLLASWRPSDKEPSEKSLISTYLKHNSTTVVEFAEYLDRELPGKGYHSLTRELDWILLAFKTNELCYRFITEVLTVMYGNLLEYYGDPVASKSFLEGIARPNLYDDLYSLQVTDSSLNTLRWH